MIAHFRPVSNVSKKAKVRTDRFMQYLANKYDIELAKKEEKWLAQYPALKKRIEELEAQAHYPCGLEEFDDFEKLNQRIKELENGSNTKG